MKNCLLFVFGILFFCSYSASAQERTDSIVTKKIFGLSFYKQHDITLTTPRFNQVMKTEPEAYAEWKKAKPNTIAAVIFGAIGGGILGSTFGKNINNESKLIFVGASFTCLGISIPFQIKGNQHIKKAVKIYNSNL